MMPRLLNTNDYIDDLVESINNSKHFIYILALVISQDELTERVITALVRAAHRGVDINIAADFSTFGYLRGGSSWAIDFPYSKKLRRATDMQHRLRSSGIKCTWLGKYGHFFFAGRTHSKWSVIDDKVYAFGGVNLYKEGLESTDYMIKIKSDNLAQILISEQKRIMKSDSHDNRYRSRSIQCEVGIIHFDGGFPGDSNIYRRAIELVRASKKSTLVSQYCPSGKLARELKKKNSTVYYNHRNIKDPLTRLLLRYSQHTSKIISAYNRSEYLHAKLLIAQTVDGQRTALAGSHNFIGVGVTSGTREIALETTDQNIIDQLEEFIKSEVA